jgi:type I restriction enzyme S subunit
MKDGWQRKQLGELAELRGRIGWRGLTAKEYTKTGPLFLSVHSLNYGDYVDFRDAFHISEERYIESPEIILHTDDVLICKDGAGIGKVGIVGDLPDRTTINSSLLLIRSGKDIHPKFLYHSLSSPYFQQIVNSRLNGATTPHLYQRDITEFPIILPPLAEQKRIVDILDEAFEGIATAKGNAEKNLENAHALFESYLASIDSEKTPLGALVNITTGKLDANAAVEGGRYPFFTCSREIYAIDNYAFDCEAILLAGNNAVGDFNVKHYMGRFNAYQRTYVITVNEKNRVLYRFLYFQMLNCLKKFKAKSVGAGTKFLKLGMIEEMEIALPSPTEQKRIVLTLDSLNEKAKRLEAIYQQKLASLEALKKSLLHQAFTGKL